MMRPSKKYATGTSNARGGCVSSSDCPALATSRTSRRRTTVRRTASALGTAAATTSETSSMALPTPTSFSADASRTTAIAGRVKAVGAMDDSRAPR